MHAYFRREELTKITLEKITTETPSTDMSSYSERGIKPTLPYTG